MNKPKDIQIYGNLITNVTITNTSRLTTCDLSGNPLLGFDLSYLPACIKNNLYAVGSTFVKNMNYTQMTFDDINELLPTEFEDFIEYTSEPLVASATTTTRVLLKRIILTSKTTLMSTERFLSKSLFISTITTHLTQLSTRLNINTLLYIEEDAFLNQIISLQAISPFRIIKLFVDVFGLGYLVYKLVQRGSRKRHHQITDQL